MKNRILAFFLVLLLAIPVFVPLISTAEGENPSGTQETVTEAIIAPIKDNRTAMLTMTFDDGDYNTAVWLTEEFEKYDLKGSCMMIVKTNLGTDTYSASNATAEKWRVLFAKGRVEPQSHTMTHQVIPSASWATGSNASTIYNNTQKRYQYELVDSKALLEQYFPDQYILGMASSNNTLSSFSYATDESGTLLKDGDNYIKIEDGGAFAVASREYYAIRNGDRGTQSVNPSIKTDGTAGSWSSLYMHRYSDSNGSTDVAKGWLNDAISKNAWCITLCHGITETSGDFNKAQADVFFAYAGEKVADGTLWCASFSEAIRYLREKQNSTVSASLTSTSVKVKVTMADKTEDGHDLPSSVFNYPLTIKVQVPADVEAVRYTDSENKTRVSTTFTENGKYYVLIDAIPNGDEVNAELSKLKKETVNPTQLYTVCSDGDTIVGSASVSAQSNDYNPDICRKAYMKLSLDNINTETTKGAYVVLNIAETADATVSVWALSDVSWISDSLTAINAPGNDTSGSGLLSSSVLGGKAVAEFKATAGQHSIDLSSYAISAKKNGADSLTLAVTVNKSDKPVSVSFTVDTPTKVPVYIYSTDCDSNVGLIGAGAESDSPQTIDSSDNHSGNQGGSAVHIVTTKSYQRPFLKYILNQSNKISADMIGLEYVVTFWLKSTAAGSCYVRMADGIKRPSSGYNNQQITVSSENVGQWVQYTYTFTVTQAQIDAIGTHISFQPSGFSQSQAAPVTIYIDDIVSTCYASSDVVALSASSLTYLGAESNEAKGILYNSDASPKGIKVGYAQATIPSGLTHATLSFNLSGASGKNVSVYGLNELLPEILTFQNAVGLTLAGTVNTEEVYGKKEFATMKADAGVVTLDITQYAEATSGKLCFLFTSTDSDTAIPVDSFAVDYYYATDEKGYTYTYINGDTVTSYQGFLPTLPSGATYWIGSDGNLYTAKDELPQADITLTVPHISQIKGAALSLSESRLFFGAEIDNATKDLLSNPLIQNKLTVSISEGENALTVTDEGDLYTVCIPFTDPSAVHSVVVTLVWGDEKTVVATAAHVSADHDRAAVDVAAAALADLHDTSDARYLFAVGSQFSPYGSIDRDFLTSFLSK